MLLAVNKLTGPQVFPVRSYGSYENNMLTVIMIIFRFLLLIFALYLRSRNSDVQSTFVIHWTRCWTYRRCLVTRRSLNNLIITVRQVLWTARLIQQQLRSLQRQWNTPAQAWSLHLWQQFNVLCVIGISQLVYLHIQLFEMIEETDVGAHLTHWERGY